MQQAFFFTQDDSPHWYMIPAEKRERWNQLNNRPPEIDGWDEYDYDNAINDEFGGYMTGGGISAIEFIPVNNK